MSGHRKPGCNRAGPPGDQGREWRPVQRCGDCVFQCTGFLLLRKRAESERPCGEIRRLRLYICAQLSALRPGQCTPDWGYQHRLLGRGRSAGIQPSGKLCDFRPGREPLFRSGSACCGKIHRCRIAPVRRCIWTLSVPFTFWGLRPNAARLSVRFFYRNTFGQFLRNVNAHHERMKIVGSRYEFFPLWAMLRETVNPNTSDKSPSPVMSGAVARAIFSGTSYPAALLEATMLRIRLNERSPRAGQPF